MSRDRNKCKVTEIELMAYEMERLFIEAEIKQTLPKKHPSIVKAEALYNAGYRKQSENVIELPCKVGDTVYYINEHYDIYLHKDTIYEAKVARMVITKNNEISLVIHIKDESGLMEYPNVKDFGKTVFLTKEGAEAKMKGGAE